MEAIDNILNTLTKWTEEKMPINPEAWLDAGLKLNVLKEGLNVNIIALQSSLARKRYQALLNNDKASHANIAIEADPEYEDCSLLKARVQTIEEHIRLAKIRAKMGLEDYRSQQ